MGSSGTQSNGERLYPTRQSSLRKFAVPSPVWVTEWIDENGSYRVNENPHEDVARYLYKGLKTNPDIKQARLTCYQTVSEFKV